MLNSPEFRRNELRKMKKLEVENYKLNQNILQITKWSRFREERKRVIDGYIQVKRTGLFRVHIIKHVVLVNIMILLE